METKKITQKEVREWLRIDKIGWHDAAWHEYRFSRRASAIGHAIHEVISQTTCRKELYQNAARVGTELLATIYAK